MAIVVSSFAGLIACVSSDVPAEPEKENISVEIRGVYGGIPGSENFEAEESLADFGVDAVFLNSRSITADTVEAVHSQGGRNFCGIQHPAPGRVPERSS